MLGPAPASVSSAEHEQRLKELLSGQTPAERLPLVATATDVGHDPELYDSLTTELGRPSSYCLKARATAAEFNPAPGKQSRLRLSVEASGKRP